MSAGVVIINETVTSIDGDDPGYGVVMTCIVLYGTLIVVGLVAVTVFIAAQINGRKTFAQFTFFKIVRHLTICNAVFLFIQATSVFPGMLITTSETDVVATVWNRVGEILTELCDQGVLYFAFLMALNRASVFVLPYFSFLFTGWPLRIFIASTWALASVITTIRLVLGPSRLFNRKTLTFSSVFINPNASVFYTITTFLGYISPLVMIALYLLIFLFLQKKRAASWFSRSVAVSTLSTPSSTSNDDFQNLVQSLVVCLSLEFTRLIATVAPMMKLPPWATWTLNIAASASSVLNHTLNPLIFILTNRKVRNAVKTIPRNLTQSSGSMDKRVETLNTQPP